MSDKIREAFDAWRSSNGWQRPDDPGEWEAWQAALAQRPTDAMLDEMRHRGLSIDGDNAYKRDLIDCIIGALVCGKQNTNPPPAGHWAQQFWEIGRAEGEIQEGGSTPVAPEPAAQEPVAWIVVDEPFHGASGVEVGEWDVEFERKAIDTLAAANSPGRIALYAAPPTAEQPDTVLSMLGEDDMYWLRRFRECCEDDEDEHDLPETAILSLEALGALRSIGYEQHEITKFGDYLLGKESV